MSRYKFEELPFSVMHPGHARPQDEGRVVLRTTDRLTGEIRERDGGFAALLESCDERTCLRRSLRASGPEPARS